MKRLVCYSVVVLLLLLTACRGEEVIYTSEYEILPMAPCKIEDFSDCEPIGIYLLNEGNMGSNKATIDYVDFCNATYVRNIYSERNPKVVKELGDVGNDIQIYGSKLYAVINCSHKVEVMDVRTCERIAQIDIPNCRYICFADGRAYVTSYVGPVSMSDDTPLGALFEIDTATLRITDRISVGYQPEGVERLGEHLYVANSGGYRKPNYDNTVSIVGLRSFKQVEKLPVRENLSHIKSDRYGKLWVVSRGDYEKQPATLLTVTPTAVNYAVDTLHIPCTNFCISGDSLYFFATLWNEQTQTNTLSYGIVHTKTKELLSTAFITDGTEKSITTPYGIAVNPYNGDIYLTDAKNYVSSGQLHCYSREGKLKWSVRTGDIPAHLTFCYR